MPELSIIVTSYNIENFIEQCLDSLVSQTFDDIELIVVDDGSTDSTPEKIAKFAQRDPRIRPILLEENTVGGVATAANTGLDAAVGEYVGFADGDDYCEPHMFERLLNSIKLSDSDLALCKYKTLDEGSGEFGEPAEAARWLDVSEKSYVLDEERKKQFLRFIAVPWRKLYKRSFLEENAIRFPVGDYFYEDNPFHWFVLTKANSISVVPEVLCYHRISRAGQTMSTADETLFRIFFHHDTIKSWLERHGIEATFRTTLLSWVISQLEWISARTPDNLRQTLFQRTVPIFSSYSEEDFRHALSEGKKGQRAKDLSEALRTKDYKAFVRCLAGTRKTESLLATGFYHLRYSGLRRTAALTSQYLSNRIPFVSSSKSKWLKRRNNTAATNEDVLFSLVVIQQNIKALEKKIDEMNQERGSGR